MRRNAYRPKLKIDFENGQHTVVLSYGLKMLVRRAIEQTLKEEQYGNAVEVSVTFTDNEGIRQMNSRFRHIDSATDVLSFPLLDFEGEAGEPPVDEWETMLGDIVISLEKAKEQAATYGHSFEREVAFLCVHAMLHLLGYDHIEPEDEQLMRERQRVILDAMGLGNGGED